MIKHPTKEKELNVMNMKGLVTKIECPTFLKKQKKTLSITWIDYDDESEGESDNKVMVLLGNMTFAVSLVIKRCQHKS